MPRQFTQPTPFIIALGACHTVTSKVFLNRNIALRTILEVNRNGPFLQLFSLILLASQILMPRNYTSKAEYLFAIVTFNLNHFFRLHFDYNILALRIWTVLFRVTHHHYLIIFKLHKFLICGFIADFLDKKVR